jgi:uncharacterized protein YbjT (DUF2867 family)
MYAIMGITGQVGSAVAENLLAQGKKGRAIVRNPEKAASWKDRGAEIAVADYDDPNAPASAFEGTDGVGHEQTAADILHVKGCKTLRNRLVLERLGVTCGRVASLHLRSAAR